MKMIGASEDQKKKLKMCILALVILNVVVIANDIYSYMNGGLTFVDGIITGMTFTMTYSIFRLINLGNKVAKMVTEFKEKHNIPEGE